MSDFIAKGIDVSHWQGAIDWFKVKQSGKVDFAILKAGGSDKGFYKDSRFEQNYAECRKHCIPVGAYYFVGKGCVTRNDGVADAVRFAKMLDGKQFGYPVVMDVEAQSPASRTGTTEAVKGFCDYMESLGYYVSIYGSEISGFKDRMDVSQLVPYDKWVARYGKKQPTLKHGLWQYTSSGKIDGIKTFVDMDYSYKDYPTIMKNHKLNGF